MVQRMEEGWIARYLDIEGETLWEYRPDPAETIADTLALLWLELSRSQHEDAHGIGRRGHGTENTSQSIPTTISARANAVGSAWP
jgi:hypothetical protein